MYAEGQVFHGCIVKLGAVGNLGWGEILGEIFKKSGGRGTE